MAEFLEILTHGRRLKAQLKGLTLDELQEVIAKMQKIAEEREEELAAENAANAERIAKIEAIRKQLAEDGISLEELNVLTEAAPRKKRAPRPPKYEITVDGEHITWTGQGRTPKAIKEKLDAGHSLEEFLIKG
ncbi:histone family protein nucleoid-structuring protein H-NS [Ferrimonas balearica DSM 9799]|uniref:DNA-binding protein n=1 Tax=Ferrimonas balearica (strain DSM 9799 / CCM 4581 / KCTC 23876 / PAT) TaxID=550540 RepID=E1SU41_FERBD|nr:H-NS family nucleoid-associated regulatory protein [Ferrimonas balearica]ADN75188.1 histone family protein nucleoid-structuring protein H-NS [Ferrimonas balearica DSM 9799]MBY5978851.1 H-NS histone family protein [Ferrimonas balearica]